MSMIRQMALCAAALMLVAGAAVAEEKHRHGEHHHSKSSTTIDLTDHSHDGLESIADEVADVATHPDGPDGMERAEQENIDSLEAPLCPNDDIDIDCDPYFLN